ncbi:MAG: hypothetical protein GWO24_33785 [Akkermansiaceae bacterium]|nr:hypothetical protein [Akkermansiaceae bacterium]
MGQDEEFPLGGTAPFLLLEPRILPREPGPTLAKAIRDLSHHRPDERVGDQRVLMPEQDRTVTKDVPPQQQDESGEQAGADPGAESVAHSKEARNDQVGSGVRSKPADIARRREMIHDRQQGEEDQEIEEGKANRRIAESQAGLDGKRGMVDGHGWRQAGDTIGD